jgi:hypothetical protein
MKCKLLNETFVISFNRVIFHTCHYNKLREGQCGVPDYVVYEGVLMKPEKKAMVDHSTDLG